MLTASEEAYFRTSISAIQIIEGMTSLAGKKRETVKRVMDFGCGYGRVLRTFTEAYPNATVTACDLMSDAITFCEESLGAIALQSHEDLSKIPETEPFDVIWAGSVFTHLPADRWEEFISFLRDRLAPEGVMLFSTHGRTAMWVFYNHTWKKHGDKLSLQSLEKADQDMRTEGWSFIPYSNKHTDQLVKYGINVTENRYGLSFSTPAWISRYCERFPELALVGVAEGGWGNNHDVVALRKPALIRDISVGPRQGAAA